MSKTGAKKNISPSAAVIAILALFSVNIWLVGQKEYTREHRFDPHASDALSISQYCRAHGDQPDIGLLGSSLVAVSSVQSSAIGANKAVDRLTHRASEYFDHALQRRLGVKSNTVCLALGGAMASDAYLVTKRALGSDLPPRALIYGISVRDFQDNMMFGVETSEAFKLFYEAEDLPDIWRLPKVTPDTKLSLTLASFSPLWDNRIVFSKTFESQAVGLLNRAFPILTATPVTSAASAAIAEVAKPAPPPCTMKIDGPLLPGESVDHPTADHMKEAYLMRYNPIAPSQIKTQFAYLERLLELCNKRHVPILVVNMPITPDNVAIMPPQLYDYYMMETQNLCRKHAADFRDMNTAPLNSPTNFLETVHLNPQGSTAFYDALAQAVGKSAIARSLSPELQYASTTKEGSL